MRSYHVARAVFTLFSTLAWIVILAGGALAIISAGMAAERSSFGNDMVALMAAIPGAILSLLGFVMLVLSQIGRAGVDTAEYSQQMLKASRDHMEVSQQLVRQGEKLEQGYAALAAKLSEPTSVSYDGRLAPAEVPVAAAASAAPLPVAGEAAAKVGFKDAVQIEQGVPMPTLNGANAKTTSAP